MGYESSSKWWLDSAGNFLGQLGSTPGFSAMRIPISSNRTSERNYIAGPAPHEPERWCDYLRSVRAFWAEHGAVRAEAISYVFGVDEPGLAGQRLVARQAAVVHRCFAGGMQLMTGNPAPSNTFLWDGKGGDDLDVWTVLSRRYYGKWTGPRDERERRNRSRQYLSAIHKVRARGKLVWSYTYTGTAGTPGFAATEPLSNPRMLMLWSALEGIAGMLYGQGTTSYSKANPFDSVGTGEFVLLYPGPFGPLPSARLEQIRDGIEDWAIFQHGASAARCRRRSFDSRQNGSLQRDSSGRATRVHAQLRPPIRDEVRVAAVVPRRDDAAPHRGREARRSLLGALADQQGGLAGTPPHRAPAVCPIPALKKDPKRRVRRATATTEPRCGVQVDLDV